MGFGRHLSYPTPNNLILRFNIGDISRIARGSLRLALTSATLSTLHPAVLPNDIMTNEPVFPPEVSSERELYMGGGRRQPIGAAATAG
jgi:hypothetical protein